MRRSLFALVLVCVLAPFGGLASAQDLDSLFHKGMAAIGAAETAKGERRDELLDTAIGSFREMLVAQPDLVRVRLELARAFYFKGDDDLARRHFEQVLVGPIPEPVAANIRRFLNDIRGRRRWDFNVGLALAPDSNLGAVSGDDIIMIDTAFGRLPFTLDQPAEEESGIGIVVWGGAEYQVPLSDRVRLRAGADMARREYERSNFDQLFVGTHAGPRWLLDAQTEASVLASARQRWLGTAPDSRDLGVRLEMAHRLSKSVIVQPQVSWHGRRYRTEARSYMDGPVWDAALWGAWIVTPTVRATLSSGYARERPRLRRERNRSRTVDAGVEVLLPLGFTVGAGAGTRWTNYESGWWPFVKDGEARKDRTRTLRASAHNRAWTVLGFSPALAVTHEIRDTNAQLHDYRRTYGELRFVRQF